MLCSLILSPVIFKIIYVPANKTPVTATNNDIPADEVVKSRYISTRELIETSIKTKETTMRNMTGRVFRLNLVLFVDSVINIANTGIQYKSNPVYSKSSIVQLLIETSNPRLKRCWTTFLQSL
jgi:hypothetical protein